MRGRYGFKFLESGISGGVGGMAQLGLRRSGAATGIYQEFFLAKSISNKTANKKKKGVHFLQ